MFDEKGVVMIRFNKGGNEQHIQQFNMTLGPPKEPD